MSKSETNNSKKMTNQALNICFVALYAFPLLARFKNVQVIGGAELQMVIVARHLAARGHRVSMICLNYGQEEQELIDGIRVYRAFKPNEGVPVLRFLYPRLTSLWRCLKAAEADLYYQQTAGMLTGVVAKFCKSYGKKSVFASASNPDLEKNTTRIKYARDRLIYSYGLRHVDKIFVQNHEQARLCEENLSRSCSIVRNCYDPPVTQVKKEGGNEILWVSTIRALKRPEKFLEIAAALPDLKFKMIGGPDESNNLLFETVRERANKAMNIEFLGFLPFWETEKQFDSAIIVVNTSDSEGVPNAFLQAWARGIPTVSFIDPGAEFKGEMVGRIVGDLPEMIATIRELASDGDARKNEGLRAIDYIREFHSSATVIPEYERLFADICMEGRSLEAKSA